MNIFHSLPRNVFQQLSTILVAYLCRYNQNNTSVKYASPKQGRSDVQRWKAWRRGAGPHACPIVIGGTTTDYCREETWQAQPTCASRPRPSRVRVNSSFAPIKESATYLHRKGERTIEMHRSFWEFLKPSSLCQFLGASWSLCWEPLEAFSEPLRVSGMAFWEHLSANLGTDVRPSDISHVQPAVRTSGFLHGETCRTRNTFRGSPCAVNNHLRTEADKGHPIV